VIEQPSPLSVHGRGDHKSEFVNQARLEERLGQRDAAVDPDVATGLTLEIGDELGETVTDDRTTRPPLLERRRGDHELLDAIDEAREWLNVTVRPESSQSS